MIHKNKIIYFLTAVISLSILGSCIDTEDYLPAQNNASGNIEFVARPVSYSGQTVQTKATSVDDFENRIHNCYFMLFNSAGARVLGPVDMNAMLTTQRISKHEILSLLGSETTCTACFIANVPTDIVQGLTTLDAVNSTVLDIAYSSVDVQDTGSGNKLSSFVIPEFDLDGDGGNESIQCLPMFGMDECNLANSDVFQISLKRLFAKVSINVSVSASGASLDIRASHLFNLPTSVRLAESGVECPWVKDAASFLAHQIEGPIDDDNITGGYSGIGGASTYEFYFYVPEYYLLPVANTTENFGNEKFKPQMFESGKRPVFVRIFGTYNDNSQITYDLYLGEDAATSFTLKRNVHYMNSMVINGITNSKDGEGTALDCRVEVTTEQFDEVEVLGQTANCYIIGQTGTYKYPACKGVFKGGVNNIPEDMKCTKGTTLKMLYRDNSSIQLDNLTYDENTSEFSFDVVSLDGGTGAVASNDGNVILGLVYTEGGKQIVEWSWHLWFQSGTSLDADLGFFDFSASNQTYPSGDILMDRNLGAKPTSLEYAGVTSGAFYKYGHKEPFLGGAYQGGGESDTYDWSGTDKSETDPCPPGYRVPASTVWNGSATHENADLLDIANLGTSKAYRYWNYGTTGLLNRGDDVYYPYSGYVEGATLKTGQGGKTVNDGVEGFTYPYQVPVEGSTINAIEYAIQKIWEPREYRNVTYSYVENENDGYLWSLDRNNTFFYKYIESSTSINCEVRTATVKWERKGWTNYTCKSISWGSWSSMSNIATTVAGYSDLNTAVNNDIDSKGHRSEPIQHDDEYTPPQNYGLQVRCVRE